MKRTLLLLLALLLATPGFAQSTSNCEIDSTFPADVLAFNFEHHGFRWVGPAALTPVGMFPTREDTCSLVIEPNPRAAGSTAAVHSAAPDERTWRFRVAQMDGVNSNDTGIFPFWSLDLADSRNQVAWLTAALMPGQQLVRLTLTQGGGDDDFARTTLDLPIKTAPLCADFRIHLSPVPRIGPSQPRSNSGGLLEITPLCGNGDANGARLLLGSGLLPVSVRVGDLSSEAGPEGRFVFVFSSRGQ